MLKQYNNGYITEYQFRPPEFIKGQLTFHEPISISIAIAAAATSIASSIAAGQAAEAQSRAQAKLYEYNARLQEAEGRARMQAAQEEEQKISGQQKRFLGYQKAAFAKSGFSIEEGSSVDVMANTWGEFAKDRLLTLRNGMLEQMSLNSSAGLERAKGAMAITRGKNYKRASYLDAVGSGLGFGSQLNWGGSTLKSPNMNHPKGTLSKNMSYVDEWMDN
jgi:hypothetical protein